MGDFDFDSDEDSDEEVEESGRELIQIFVCFHQSLAEVLKYTNTAQFEETVRSEVIEFQHYLCATTETDTIEELVAGDFEFQIGVFQSRIQMALIESMQPPRSAEAYNALRLVKEHSLVSVGVGADTKSINVFAEIVDKNVKPMQTNIVYRLN
jgi:hypothetical protein